MAVAEKDSAPRTPSAKPQAAKVPAGKLFALGIREDIPSWMTWGLGIVPIAVLLLAWFLVTAGAAEERIISPTILPSPLEVARSFPELWFDRALMRNLMISLGRVIGGFALAVAVTFPLGLLMGSFTRVKAAFSPLSVLGAYLPIPALVPLTMSLFGTGEWQKILFLALAFITDKLWATVERGLFPYRREGR